MITSSVARRKLGDNPDLVNYKVFLKVFSERKRKVQVEKMAARFLNSGRNAEEVLRLN